MSCQFPEHHSSSHRAPWVLVALVAAAVVEIRLHAAAIESFLRLMLIVGIGVIAVGIGALVLILRPGRARHIPVALWARIRWHWLSRNLQLARPDLHRAGKVRRLRARFRVDRYGLVVRVKTRPGTGRAEIEKAADHLANSWRVVRVSVSQPKPGRVLVRGLKVDPLTLPLSASDIPVRDQNPARPYIGLDEWAQHRYLSLANCTGIVIGGLPGRGKSELISSLICQWAVSPAVQLATIDGKGSSDYAVWDRRAWLQSGDDLDDALAVLEDAHSIMRKRLGSVLAATGHKNAWVVGPTVNWPLLVVILDECQVFLDSAAVKGRKPAEDQVRRCQSLVAELVRKGRSAMVVTVLATQKATTDSLPSSIRDNAGASLCFGVKTLDAAAAVLGADIRAYPSFSPTMLQDDAYTGVLTSTLRSGQDPFTRIRVPLIGERVVEARADATASFRRDPSRVRVAA